MNERDELHTIISEWVRKAEADFAASVHLAKEQNEQFAETICFHAQQSVEKYIKAMLVLNMTDFPKTHDLQRLVDMLPKTVERPMSVAEMALLTPYAVTFRYPGEPSMLTLRDAREAVRVARRVRRQARQILPREAQRRRRA